MRALIRDAVAVALVSGLVFQSLRQWVAERYLVPSSSMQPTLHGASVGGDVVLVDKLAATASLRRFDLGVFRAPGEDNIVVKRAVAFGSDPEACCLELRDGDLWLGPDARHLQRVVKDPLDTRDMRVPWLRWPGPQAAIDECLAHPGGSDPSQLLLPTIAVGDARASCTETVRRALASAQSEHGEGDGGGWLVTRRAVDATYLDAFGNRGGEPGTFGIVDIGAELTFAADGVADLFCGIDLRPDAWLFHWRLAGGSLELWRNGTTVATHVLPADVRPSGAAPVRVEFGHLDGRFFFAVDGRRDALWCEVHRAEWLAPDPGPVAMPMPRNRLWLAAAASRPVPLARLQVFRDIHWFRPPMEIGVDPATFSAAKVVPPGCVYLLGDNSLDSRDSRMFGAVPLSGFVGRPRCILGPWPRRRWLAR